MRPIPPILFVTAFLGGCDYLVAPYPTKLKRQAENWFAGLDAARPSAPYVSDFVRLFPDAQVNYSYFAPKREPGFDLVVVLEGRYELNMKLPVTFDPAGRQVVSYGEPQFYLSEAAEVVGRCVSYNPAHGRQFGSSEWKKVVENGGDFGAIGYTVLKSQPVAGLQELMVEGQRGISPPVAPK
jgi:hypothetical protein